SLKDLIFWSSYSAHSWNSRSIVTTSSDPVVCICCESPCHFSLNTRRTAPLVFSRTRISRRLPLASLYRTLAKYPPELSFLTLTSPWVPGLSDLRGTLSPKQLSNVAQWAGVRVSGAETFSDHVSR